MTYRAPKDVVEFFALPELVYAGTERHVCNKFNRAMIAKALNRPASRIKLGVEYEWTPGPRGLPVTLQPDDQLYARDSDGQGWILLYTTDGFSRRRADF